MPAGPGACPLALLIYPALQLLIRDCYCVSASRTRLAVCIDELPLLGSICPISTEGSSSRTRCCRAARSKAHIACPRSLCPSLGHLRGVSEGATTRRPPPTCLPASRLPAAVYTGSNMVHAIVVAAVSSTALGGALKPVLCKLLCPDLPVDLWTQRQKVRPTATVI